MTLREQYIAHPEGVCIKGGLCKKWPCEFLKTTIDPRKEKPIYCKETGRTIKLQPPKKNK